MTPEEMEFVRDIWRIKYPQQKNEVRPVFITSVFLMGILVGMITMVVISW